MLWTGSTIHWLMMNSTWMWWLLIQMIGLTVAENPNIALPARCCFPHFRCFPHVRFLWKPGWHCRHHFDKLSNGSFLLADWPLTKEHLLGNCTLSSLRCYFKESTSALVFTQTGHTWKFLIVKCILQDWLQESVMCWVCFSYVTFNYIILF